MKMLMPLVALLSAPLSMAAPDASAQPAPVIQPSRSIGFQQVAIADPGHAPIVADIWYPTDAAPAVIQAGPIAVKGAMGGAVDGNGLPAILVSHGTGAASISHLDTLVALAEAGFVAVAITHNGDNFRDDAIVGKPAWFADRARHATRAVDYLLREWKDAAHLGGKIGMFGFSAGATTALIAAGGVPDLGKIGPHCAQHAEFVCQIMQPATGAEPPVWSHDKRIGALVLAAPGIGFAFDAPGLSAVRVPIQLWVGADDQTVPYASNAGMVRSALPQPVDFHQVSGARHLSFLMPCGAVVIPQLCEDSPGFDRAAFHASFNRAMVDFFRKRL